MKTLLIIIPGSEIKTPKLFKSTLLKLYKFFGVDLEGDKWCLDLKKHIEKHTKNIKTIIFKWSGGISRKLSINPAAKKLSTLLKNTNNYDRIILLGKSFGGTIAEEAIRSLPEIRNKKLHIIYIATPHKNLKTALPPRIKITNIFSDKDIFLSFAIKLINFGFGNKTLKNANNIILKNLKHADFNKNIVIFYKGKKKKLFDLYTKLISK